LAGSNLLVGGATLIVCKIAAAMAKPDPVGGCRPRLSDYKTQGRGYTAAHDHLADQLFFGILATTARWRWEESRSI